MSKLTKIALFVVVFSLIAGPAALAQTEPVEAGPESPTNVIAPSSEAVDEEPNEEEGNEAAEEIELDEIVTAEDLGVKEPKLLPDSKFYFLKSWGRGIRSAFTFNKTKKAELKLKYSSEKLLEARKLADKKKRPEILEKAAENYQREIEKIKTTVDAIKEKATQNPTVGKFLDKFVQKQVLHQKILDKLEEKVPEGALEKIKAVKEKQLERFGQVMEKLEDKEQIKVRLENNLKKIKGSEFKGFKDMQILKRIEEKAPEAIKEKIMEAREATLEKFQEKVTEMKPEAQKKLQHYVGKVKGLAESKMEILEDVKLRVQEAKPEIKERLESARDQIINRVREKKEEHGVRCPELGPKPQCRGRVIMQKDENGCPVIRCVEVTEVKPTTLPAPSPTPTLSPAPSTVRGTGKPEPTTEKPRQACIALWSPVCGVNGKTYSNACNAKVAGVEIQRKGVCDEKPKPVPVPKPTPKPVPLPRPAPTEPTPTPSNTTAPSPVSSDCTDTDGGKNNQRQGVVSYRGKKYIDYCTNSKTLIEYFCTDAATAAAEKMGKTSHICVRGCQNGACTSNISPPLPSTIKEEPAPEPKPVSPQEPAPSSISPAEPEPGPSSTEQPTPAPVPAEEPTPEPEPEEPVPSPVSPEELKPSPVSPEEATPTPTE